MLKASTPAQYILILVDLAREQGCSREALLAGTSLEREGIAGIGARVSDTDFTRVCQNALELTGDPALGLRLGMRLNLSAHAVLGQAFLTCRDLEQVLDLFMRYYHLLSTGLEVEISVDRERCTITMVSNPEQVPEPFAYELVLSAMANTLRGLLNRPDLAMLAEFPYPPPAHAPVYREVFGDDLRFNAPCVRLSMDAALLATPLPSSNPTLRDLYEQECSRLLADLEEEDSVAEQTLQLLRKFEGQYPQMPQLARMLNLSPRTYRRRLEAEGQAFQELLDRVRAEHATRYLRTTRLPLSTIAYMVGFNDASNFRRAFIKWTGRSPRDVRASAEAQTAAP